VMHTADVTPGGHVIGAFIVTPRSARVDTG
jgi:hypothetical protein